MVIKALIILAAVYVLLLLALMRVVRYFKMLNKWDYAEW